MNLDQKQPGPAQAPNNELFQTLNTSEAPDFMHTLVANWKPLAAAVVAALVIAVGYGLFKSYQQKAKEQAENELGQILVQKEGADKLVALENFLAKAPDGVKPAALLELAKTSMEQGQFKKAADAFAQLAKSATPAMEGVAVLGQAAALSQAGDNAQAAALLSAAKTKLAKPFEIAVNRQLALYAEQAGDYAGALAAYETLRELAKRGPTSYFDAKIAELKAKAGKEKPAS